MFDQPPAISRATISYHTSSDGDRNKSRKRDRVKSSTVRVGDPTQSPAQKTVKLKSLVMIPQP